MPLFPYEIRRSTAHRVACIALYRVLLTQCNTITIPTELQRGKIHPIKHIIRKQFRVNRYACGKDLIVAALKIGYEAEELFHSANCGDKNAYSKIIELLREHQVERTETFTRIATSPPPRPRPKHEIPAPFPGAIPLLKRGPRPSLDLKGKRYIPKLTQSGGIPFLRTKSFQGTYLARILRQKIEWSAKNLVNVKKITEEDGKWASDEMMWDYLIAQRGQETNPGQRKNIVLHTTDRVYRDTLRSSSSDLVPSLPYKNKGGGLPGNTPWAKMLTRPDKQGNEDSWAKAYIDQTYAWARKNHQARVNRRETAVQMQRIVEQERALAAEEKRARKREKEEKRKERKRAREATASQEKLE